MNGGSPRPRQKQKTRAPVNGQKRCHALAAGDANRRAVERKKARSTLCERAFRF
jgi:hypothetical protein